jgi:hypothetical protein
VIFAKVDVTLPFHHRILRVPRERRAAALGLWLAALCYSRAHELNGFAPLESLELYTNEAVTSYASNEAALGAELKPARSRNEAGVSENSRPAHVPACNAPTALQDLVTVGLLAVSELDGVPGVVVCKYAKHNETRTDIRERRATTLERVRKHRRNASQSDRRNALQNTLLTRTESESESELESESDLNTKAVGASRAPAAEKLKAKPRRRIPSDWHPTPETIASFRADGVDAAACVQEFVEYWTGEGRPKADWEATFRGHVRRLDASGRAPECPVPARSKPPHEPACPPPPGVLERIQRLSERAKPTAQQEILPVTADPGARS